MTAAPASAVLELHEALHAELLAEYATETEAWATERLARVAARLNAVRPDGVPVDVHCLWMREFTAFTTPAPHVYVSRRLLERMPTDEAMAFVVAHEIAHHDLKHVDVFRGWLDALPRGVAGSIAAVAFRQMEHRLHGPERERDADLYAVELCLDAGYDGARCVQAFEVMERVTLDAGGVDAVYGPENLLDPTDPGAGGALYAAQRWLSTRARRYLPLRERRDDARAYLARRLRERAARR